MKQIHQYCLCNENGQNGTLTLYPGSYGETWLGADGVTITIGKVMKATRGMRNDIMVAIQKAKWSEIKNSNKKYTRYLTYLDETKHIPKCIAKLDAA